jgi:hypothetical protein
MKKKNGSDAVLGALLGQMAFLSELSALLIRTRASVEALTELAIDLRSEQGYDRERTQEWLRKLRDEYATAFEQEHRIQTERRRDELLRSLAEE